MDWERLTRAVARSEGFSAYPYKDSEGYWTIGHGILIDKKKGQGLSREESREIMQMRLDVLYLRLSSDPAWGWFDQLSPLRKEALIRMAYNLGMSGLKKFKRMIKALQEEKYSLAAEEALDSKWAKQVGNRATRIANNIRRG